MPQFVYEGRTDAGKRKKGRIAGQSRKEAVLMLREKGVVVTDLRETKETFLHKEITVFQRVKSEDFVIFLRQFATLLSAGVSVVNAARVLAEQTESKQLKKALYILEDEVRAGKTLSQAAAENKKVFPSLFINMVKAGEAASNLEVTFNQMANYYEKQFGTKQKVVSALIYPLVVAVISAAVVGFLLVFVVPTFTEMFSQFGAELPWITSFVLESSRWMQRFWWVPLLLALAITAAVYFLNRQEKGKYYMDYLCLKLPVFGKMFQKSAISRFSRALGSLLSSSVPVLQAVAVVENIAENEVVRKVLRESRVSLEEGESMGKSMRKSPIIPSLVTQMIAIGEETNSLGFMFSKIADFYESEVDTSTDRLKSLVEPLIIVVLSAIVGFIVMSIVIPMFDIYSHIGGI